MTINRSARIQWTSLQLLARLLVFDWRSLNGLSRVAAIVRIRASVWLGELGDRARLKEQKRVRANERARGREKIRPKRLASCKRTRTRTRTSEIICAKIYRLQRWFQRTHEIEKSKRRIFYSASEFLRDARARAHQQLIANIHTHTHTQDYNSLSHLILISCERANVSRHLCQIIIRRVRSSNHVYDCSATNSYKCNLKIAHTNK